MLILSSRDKSIRYLYAEEAILHKSSGEGLLGKDVVELFLRYKTVLVDVSQFDHFLEFIVVMELTEFLSHASQITNVNEAYALGIAVPDFSSSNRTKTLLMSSRLSFSVGLTVIMVKNSSKSI